MSNFYFFFLEPTEAIANDFLPSGTLLNFRTEPGIQNFCLLKIGYQCFKSSLKIEYKHAVITCKSSFTWVFRGFFSSLGETLCWSLRLDLVKPPSGWVPSFSYPADFTNRYSFFSCFYLFYDASSKTRELPHARFYTVQNSFLSKDSYTTVTKLANLFHQKLFWKMLDTQIWKKEKKTASRLFHRSVFKSKLVYQRKPKV